FVVTLGPMNRSSLAGLLFLVFLLAGIATGAALFDYTRDPVSLAVPSGTGLVLGWLLAKSARVVPQWERMILLRLGKYSSTVEPGFRLIVPVIDTPLYVEMRTQTVNIEKQQTITQDNVPVVVNGVIFFKVIDPATAALKVQDYRL